MKIAKNLLFFICFSLFLSGFGPSIFAQSDNKPVFVGDLDGNGKMDRIIQTKFQKPTQLPSRKDLTKQEIRNGHDIKYVLYRDGQEKGMTIFEYLIGDDEAVYWVFEIEKAVDLNKDGWKDLIFYAGDDTTQEYVFLIQKHDYFKAVYSGTIPLDMDFGFDFDKSNNIIQKFTDSKTKRIVAKWNPQSEIFEGIKVKWIGKDCNLYEKPDTKSEVSIALFEDDLILVADDEQNSRNKWQKVNTGWSVGWIETKFLKNLSPAKKFPDK